jgi:hypothetical protein
MSRRRIMSSHAPIKVAAHLLRLDGALDDGNYDIALPDADRQRAAEIPSLPQRAAFGSWQRFEKWRIFRRIVLEPEILMLTMMMSPLGNSCKSMSPPLWRTQFPKSYRIAHSLINHGVFDQRSYPLKRAMGASAHRLSSMAPS